MGFLTFSSGKKMRHGGGGGGGVERLILQRFSLESLALSIVGSTNQRWKMVGKRKISSHLLRRTIHDADMGDSRLVGSHKKHVRKRSARRRGEEWFFWMGQIGPMVFKVFSRGKQPPTLRPLSFRPADSRGETRDCRASLVLSNFAKKTLGPWF